MSTEKRSFMDSLTIMAETFKGLSGVMVGHGGHSEVARQHAEQIKKEVAKQKDSDEYSPFNTVNS
jgi:hypothetical protein